MTKQKSPVGFGPGYNGSLQRFCKIRLVVRSIQTTTVFDHNAKLSKWYLFVAYNRVHGSITIRAGSRGKELRLSAQPTHNTLKLLEPDSEVYWALFTREAAYVPA